MYIDQSVALDLLTAFKERLDQKQSWREVQRYLVKAGHPQAFLVSSQKLANWARPTRATPLSDQAFQAVLHFIQTSQFQERVPEARNFLDHSRRAIEAGSLVTELAGIYPPEEIETILFSALDGMWCDRENLVFLHVHKVKGHSFAIVNLCQKVHDGYGSAMGFPFRTYVDFEAVGFLYFENETHSKNNKDFSDQPRTIGQIEKSTGNVPIVRIGVSGKKMQLKLWSRETRKEVTFKAFCYCSPSDSGYEPTEDNSISVSSFFEFSFKTPDTDDYFRFDRANYISENSLTWAKATVRNVTLLKEKFDETKWSVLPNASA